MKRTNPTHNKPKAPPVPKKTYNEIPPCPKPDYDTPVRNKINDAVEMESLESFQLNNPSGPEPKPPSTYFKSKQKLSGQSSVSSATSFESMASNNQTMERKRPVSVTFSEYPSNIQRKQPGRFGFLNSTKSCEYDERETQPITSRLASELSQTLMRANLKPEIETVIKF